MDSAELYKLMAQDFADRFESMRKLEWQTTFQVYAGYGALGVVSSHLYDKLPGSRALGVAGILVVGVLWGCTFYVSLRIQERLRYTRDMQNVYLDKLHEVMNISKLARPAATPELKHQYRWAWRAQTVLSSTTALGLIAYQIARSGLWRCFI